jgi:hypothetical protein
MFRNTYPPAFYKQLHRYVHKNYQKHLAKECLKKVFMQPSNITLNGIKKGLSFAYYLPVTFLEKQKLNKLEEAW